MKAVVFESFGGPEVLALRDVPDPAIRPDEVLIEVKACAVNHLDLGGRQGLPGLEGGMRECLGNDAIQVARLIGARVIASASTAKLERVRALGAHDVVDHSRGDFAAEVRALTGKKGVEVVVEHVGGPVLEQAIAALARNGRLVTCGATLASTAKLDVNLLFGRHLTLLGSWMG